MQHGQRDVGSASALRRLRCQVYVAQAYEIRTHTRTPPPPRLRRVVPVAAMEYRGEVGSARRAPRCHAAAAVLFYAALYKGGSARVVRRAARQDRHKVAVLRVAAPSSERAAVNAAYGIPSI